MPAVVKVQDNGFTKRMRAMASLDGKVKAKAGVFGAKGAEDHDSQFSNAQMAAIHEFGLGVPERPFLRTWVDENKPEILAQLRAVAREVVEGKKTIYEGMEDFGQWAEQQLGAYLEAGIPFPLAESTIRRKGHDTPLIDTQTLLRALTHAVARETK
jgi:hypothetical protein